MNNDSLIALKTREQLSSFLGILLPRFSKPTGEFIGQMLYGIQAAQDIKLSKIARALDEPIGLKKTMERLGRHLAEDGMCEKLSEGVMEDAAFRIHRDTLIIIDPTDIQKPYAEKMPYLSKVWDGSKGRVGDNLGYSGCAAVACELDGRKILPLHLRLWSSRAPGHMSENDEIEAVVDAVSSKTRKRGIYVYDRGGDRLDLLQSFHRRGLNFIVRMVGNRGVTYRNKYQSMETVARKCRMRHAEIVEHENRRGEKTKYEIQFGSVEVKIPGSGLPPLRLVAVRGFSDKPMMLLTTLAATNSRASLEQVVHGYLSRWRVEDAIRYIKQSYNLEDMRFQDYGRLRNIMGVVLATAYFAAVWLGTSAKVSLLAKHIAIVSKRMFEVPEFFYYAIADGIAALFARHGRWERRARDCTDDLQMEFNLI